MKTLSLIAMLTLLFTNNSVWFLALFVCCLFIYFSLFLRFSSSSFFLSLFSPLFVGFYASRVRAWVRVFPFFTIKYFGSHFSFFKPAFSFFSFFLLVSLVYVTVCLFVCVWVGVYVCVSRLYNQCSIHQNI